MRCAGLLLIMTVPEPLTAVQVFGPQQTACTPLSPRRSAGFLLMFTFGEPTIAGPTPGCGQARQPCTQAGTFDLSPRRPAPGIVVSFAGSRLAASCWLPVVGCQLLVDVHGRAL